MIIYVEKQALWYTQTQKILERFSSANIIEIENYKNIFDKNISSFETKKSIILAKLQSSSITKAPSGYGHTSEAYFFKTSLNCIYDCDYCFLKGAFKNENMVFFVNYEDIFNQIKHTIYEQTKHTQKTLWFYSSDYSDILWMDNISDFCVNFIEFFEQFDEKKVQMEIRTKSANIRSLLALDFVPQNTEIAFSLNPQVLIDRYETGTASLEHRIKSINILIEKWFQVWLRFLPLLPVANYYEIYEDFIEYIQKNIDLCKISSIFASGLLYTKKDYNVIMKKFPDLDILHMLELEQDDFYRESKKVRNDFYSLFKNMDSRCILCLEN